MASSNYVRGRQFEYRTRDKLLKNGAAYVMRAASSKGAADLIALWPADYYIPEEGECPHTWLVQCKRDGRLPRAEREQLIEIAEKTGAVPVLAKTGPNGRGVEFTTLTKEK